MSLWNKIILYISSLILVFSPGNKYVEGVVGQPRSFLPSHTETQTDKTISNLIYRGLFKYDIYGSLVPDLADSWEVSEDGLVYTVTLKENQKWQDGNTITSDDVIYTSFNVPSLTGVATDRVDEKTVRFTLPNKFSPFLSLLTVGIMQSGSVENQNPLKPVSNGKFRVINVNYNGPVIKEVVLYNTDESEEIRKLAFRFYSNEEELITGAKLGEISGFTASRALDLDNFVEYRFPLQGVYYALFFNLNDDILSEHLFRTKLRDSLDIEKIVGGKGILVQGPISKSIFTDKEISTNNFQESVEEEFLGYSFDITVPNLSEHVDVAKKIKEVWEEEFNLELNLIKVSPERIIDDVVNKRDFQVLLYGQEVGRDPDRYIYWHSTQTEPPNLNITGFKHVRADRALEEGRNETDFSERSLHYNEFQAVIEEQVPAIFLYHPYVKHYIIEQYSGYGEKYTFTIGDRFLDFSNWKYLKLN